MGKRVLEKRRDLTASIFTKKQGDSSDDDEGDFDLMKEARKVINCRTATLRAEAKLSKQDVKPEVPSGALENEKIKNTIDPSMQKLFAMLPPPKQKGAG